MIGGVALGSPPAAVCPHFILGAAGRQAGLHAACVAAASVAAAASRREGSRTIFTGGTAGRQLCMVVVRFHSLSVCLEAGLGRGRICFPPRLPEKRATRDGCSVICVGSVIALKWRLLVQCINTEITKRGIMKPASKTGKAVRPIAITRRPKVICVMRAGQNRGTFDTRPPQARQTTRSVASRSPYHSGRRVTPSQT